MAKNEITFSEASVRDLPVREKRYEVADIKQPALKCRITPNGVKTFIVCKFYQGSCVRTTLGRFGDITVKNARLLAIRHLQQFSQGINPNAEKRKLHDEMTLDALWEKYLTDYARVFTAKKTVENNISIYRRRFSRWGQKPLSAINRHEIEALILKLRRTEGISAANKSLTLIRHIFNKASEWGWEGRNPTTGIKKYHLASRERFLREDEFSSFFKAVDALDSPMHRVFFYMLLYTGQRCGNVLAAQWKHIDFKMRTWFIPKTKNGTSLTVPLTDALIERLRELYAFTGGECWLFPSSQSATGYMNEPIHIWRKIKRITGITNLRIHDLRRTVGSYEAMNGVSLPIISKTLNHKTFQATQVYSRLDISPVREALNTVVEQFESLR